MVILLKIKRRDFLTGQHSSFGVMHCEYLEVQIAVFSKWNMLQEWKLVQRFTFCLSSTWCKYEFLAILTLQFDGVIVKTIYRKNNVNSVPTFALKHTYHLCSMAFTLHYHIIHQWQPWTAVLPLLGLISMALPSGLWTGERVCQRPITATTCLRWSWRLKNCFCTCLGSNLVGLMITSDTSRLGLCHVDES